MAKVIRLYYLRMKQAESLYWHKKTDSNYRSLLIARKNYQNVKQGV